MAKLATSHARLLRRIQSDRLTLESRGIPQAFHAESIPNQQIVAEIREGWQ